MERMEMDYRKRRRGFVDGCHVRRADVGRRKRMTREELGKKRPRGGGGVALEGGEVMQEGGREEEVRRRKTMMMKKRGISQAGR